MKKNKTQGLLFILSCFIILFPEIGKSASKEKQMFYELRIYKFSQPAQEVSIDNYLKEAYLPALHRAGIDAVGVFKPIERDTANFGKALFLFIPYKTADEFFALGSKLEKDTQYQSSASQFLDAPVENPPFTRYETLFLKAFAYMPKYQIPSFSTSKSERVYDMRIYESLTEAKAAKKIDMFERGGEMEIFNKVGAVPAFFGKQVIGSNMPRLIYMMTYADMKTHDEYFSAFVKHPDFRKVMGLEEYKNAMSKYTVYLFHPASYSDF